MPTKEPPTIWKRRPVPGNAMQRRIIVTDIEDAAWKREASDKWIYAIINDELCAHIATEPGASAEFPQSMVDVQSELSDRFSGRMLFIAPHHGVSCEKSTMQLVKAITSSTVRHMRAVTDISSDIQSEFGPSVIDEMSRAASKWHLATLAESRLDLEAAGVELAYDEDYTALLQTLSRYVHSALRHPPVRRGFGNLTDSTLTNPEGLLTALESREVSPHIRRALALFAETLAFDTSQRERLLPHLWTYIVERRTSRDQDELVALGSAIRKLLSYWPACRFDELADLLEPDGETPVSPEFELEVAKGLVYRLGWDADARRVSCPHMCDAMHDLASFHSSKRIVERDLSSAIAVNAILALAFLGDTRTREVADLLTKRSLPWFSSLLKSRARRVMKRLQSDSRQSSESLGLLSELVRQPS